MVAVSAFTLMLGYAIVLAAYHLQNRAPFRELVPQDSGGIVAASAAGLVIFFPYFSRAGIHTLISVRMGSGLMAAVVLMIILPMWVHPMRKRLLSWVFSRLPA